MAFGLSPEGGTRFGRHSTHASESPLHGWLRLERGVGATMWGLFLRAETMHGYYTYLADGAKGPRDPDFHRTSHGESFPELLRSRFDSPGLHCLDEPEAALSFSAQIAQIALAGTLHDLAASGAQVAVRDALPAAGGAPRSADPGGRRVGHP